MQIPLEVVFHGVARSAAAEHLITRHADKLERFYDRITSCRVVVTAPHRRRRTGVRYAVRIDITVPKNEIVVNRHPEKGALHEDLESAVRDAFSAAVRRLEDHVRKIRGDVKAHATPPHGRVSNLFPDAGYGFIETPDGDEIYFHWNSVLDGGFSLLEVGTEVRFVEEPGEHGPNATSVRPAGRHHHIT
ncbi:MAG: cold shock domain-containing protein [Planctomycetota bacterium]